MTGFPGPLEPSTKVPPVQRRRGIAVLAAILSAACWGSATVMSKGVLDHMPPMTLLAVQLTASITVLWLAVLGLRFRVRLDRPTRRASFSGILEPGLAYILGISGLALTTASNATLIDVAELLFILFLAWLVLKEQPGLAGQGSLVGDALILAGTFFAAFYVIATRRLVSTIEPLPLSALQQSVGLIWTLGVLVIALLAGLTTLGLDGLPWPVLLMATASGVIQYALAFWCSRCKACLPVSQAFYLTLTPVFGVADTTGIHVRTLQRRLAKAGIHYSQLVDEVRLEAAVHLLQDGRLTLAKISSALGYSDPAHFTRAFARWTGMTPRAYRQRKR